MQEQLERENRWFGIENLKNRTKEWHKTKKQRTGFSKPDLWWQEEKQEVES